jgi:hypothetical protein
MAMDKTGRPIVAFNDSNYLSRGTVMYLDAGGNWVSAGPHSFAPTTVFNRHALAVDTNNIAMIAFRRPYNGNRASVMAFSSLTLPLNFMSFTANYRDQNGILDWRTSKEMNTSHFNVQKSILGKEFKTLDKVRAVAAVMAL